MYVNTTFKAFVAETASRVAAELAKSFAHPHDIAMLKNEETAEDIAIAAVNVAKQTAYELQEYWKCNGDKSTVFFDPQDTPNSGIENQLADIAEKLADIGKKMEC